MSTNKTTNPEDPFERVFNTYYGTNAERHQNNVEDIIWHGEMAIVPWLEENGIEETEINETHVKKYFRELVDAYAPNTQWEYARRCRFLYNEFLSRGFEGFDANPFKNVLSDHSILETVYSEDTKIYAREEVQEVLDVLDPIVFGISMTMLKTSRRVGGTVNLDLCDVNIQHPAADWDVVKELRDKPDHLYYSPKPETGKEFRGEVRSDSSKSKSKTVIPMDDELKDTLIWILSLRRSSENSGALFTQTFPKRAGVRVTRDTYGNRIRTAAKEQGYWYEAYDPDNIKGHYWRHWTTSKMKDRVNNSIVDYFRGDTGTTSDGYNHYTKAKASAWLDNIPKIYPHYQVQND